MSVEQVVSVEGDGPMFVQGIAEAKAEVENGSLAKWIVCNAAWPLKGTAWHIVAIRNIVPVEGAKEEVAEVCSGSEAIEDVEAGSCTGVELRSTCQKVSIVVTYHPMGIGAFGIAGEELLVVVTELAATISSVPASEPINAPFFPFTK